MILEISKETSGIPEGIEAVLERVARAACETEGLSGINAFLRIVDDETIRRINRAQRNIDRATDVLSFPSVRYPEGKTARHCQKRLRREQGFAGDIAISFDTALRQAAEYGHSIEREMGYLTAHALLHLFGYDHMDEGEKRVMRDMEEKIMAKTDLRRDAQLYDTLFQKASEALENAYAPYSEYRVGACLLADDGRMFTGCNIENASYGATICAERCAVCNALAAGAKKFTAIAVVGEFSDAWPCGVCRQVLNEFSDDMQVLCGTAGKTYTVEPLTNLLPHSFGGEELVKALREKKTETENNL